MSYEAVILAAGKGSRMFSDKAKVLHHLAGKSLLAHQLDRLADIDECSRIHLVVGHASEQLARELEQRDDRSMINMVEQTQQLGTGHAAAQALPFCDSDSMILVLAGDIPLISSDIIRSLWEGAQTHQLSLLQTTTEQTFGYGRLVRSDSGVIERVVEEKDADEEQKQIQQIYCGVLAAKADTLLQWLERIDNDNAQSEYYLTDLIALAVADGILPAAIDAGSIFDYFGVNSHAQLAQLERLWQEHQAHKLMEEGVYICDPRRFDLRGTILHGRDVSIDVNTVFAGDVSFGDAVRIGAHCYLEHCEIASGSTIAPFTHISHARIGKNCLVGPYARIRPGSVLEDSVKIGNFVEIKQTHLEQHTTVSHLSYLGDAEVGSSSNLGAGTITCNYDGTNKHKTSIGRNVFVGSNSSLVAPLKIGEGATIGAGSVITKDVAPNSLAVTRSKQKQRADWRKK